MSMANDASMSLALACDVDALAAAQRRLAEFLEGAGCSERTRFRVELVIEELAMNVIMHVAPETSARGMTLWAEVDEGHVRLALEDAGPEFDPL